MTRDPLPLPLTDLTHNRLLEVKPQGPFPAVFFFVLCQGKHSPAENAAYTGRYAIFLPILHTAIAMVEQEGPLPRTAIIAVAPDMALGAYWVSLQKPTPPCRPATRRCLREG